MRCGEADICGGVNETVLVEAEDHERVRGFLENLELR